MANYSYINSTGVIVPDTSSLLTDVGGEWKGALGDDMSTNPETPQGALIVAETTARKAVVDNNVALANQINPNQAGGSFLDSVCALTGLKRAVATRSFIPGVVITGVPGAIIPEGTQCKTVDGDVFKSIGNVLLPITGTNTVDFESVEFGAIPAAASTLTSIVTAVIGLETVTNPNAAVLGTDEQSDESLRALRKVTLALQGVSLVEAIVSSLYAVPEVKSLQFRENIKSTTQTIDGIDLVAHSIWACVYGGLNSDIAQALLDNKSNGCDYTGFANTQTVNVLEPISGQTYAVKFDRPTDVPFKIKATVRAGSSLLNVEATVKNAIIAYAAGLVVGYQGFGVGNSVSPFEIAGGVAAQISGIYIQKMEVTTVAANTYQTTEVALATNKIASIIAGNIEVVIL